MSKLREVTIQYINIDDPIERAARIQIVLQGEEEGLMANTAARIIAAATSNLSARQDQSAPSPMNQAPNLLGQQEATSADIPESSNARNNRPHQAARMRTGASPRNWAGESTRMRNLLRIHSSPARHGFPHASPIQRHQARAPCNTPRGAPSTSTTETSAGFSRRTSSSSLAILSWNCCGLGNPMTVQRLKDLNKKVLQTLSSYKKQKNTDEFVLEKLAELNITSHYLDHTAQEQEG